MRRAQTFEARLKPNLSFLAFIINVVHLPVLCRIKKNGFPLVSRLYWKQRAGLWV